MAEVQPESAPAVQAFLQWKAKPGIRRTGCRGSDNMIGFDYISQVDLQDYLTTERIKTLLQELFDNTNQSPPHAERVRSNYLRPFAILLAIGYGSMIRHFVERRELQDKSLPFPAEPEDFPKTSTHNLFQAFRNEQWQFCALPLEYDMRDDLADEYILPITAKEEISGGGSAILYKITVDEVYNKLKPADDAHTAARSRTPNTFALKTYRTPDAKKYFENERNAFEQLRYGERPPENIIEYYGSFVRWGTYNIILEYADRGTLDDYLRTTAEPKTAVEIECFWGNFLASMGGLVQIHGTPPIHEPASDEPNILLGRHHDIQPSNILVMSKGHNLPYNYNFKIADLGLAHFKRYISSLNNDTDNDRYGMSTYALEKRHLLVPQSADIWSMGCVYSEVATWVTEGSAKLLEYRRRRQKEIAKKLGIASLEEDRFHHGSKILETVDEIHDEIKRISRRCDLITPYVIERLVKGMVRPHPYSRGTAQFLLDTSSEILEDAKRKPMLSGLAPNPDRTISDLGIDVRRQRLPLSLLPEQKFATEPQPIETSFSIPHPEEATIFRTQANDHDWQRRSPNEEGFPRPSHGVRKDSPNNDLAAQYDDGSRISHRLQRAASQPVRPHMQGQHGERSFRPKPPLSPLRSLENISMPVEEGSSSSWKQANVMEHTDSDRPARSQPATSWTQTYAPNGRPESRLPSVPKPNPTSQYPTMSVSEGLGITKEKKWNFVKYPGEDTFHTSDDILKKRHHVFLIDNGESMRPHRKKVEEVLELLATLTQPYDPDGLDLYFSTEPTKLRPNTPEKFLKYLRERPAYGRPDFRQRFARIIEDYQSRFGKSNHWARLRHPKSTLPRGPRPLSLYVLTDAVWDPMCTLITECKSLVSMLQEYKYPNKYVGIQFIRFGDDREGKRRLKTLDAGLGLEL
ncbi:MAG: hypothetical protein Q9180_004472 [Flavoplaca navasiana]